MPRDFFDDELRKRPGEGGVRAEREDDDGGREVLDRRKEEITSQVADAMSEIERLRRRQMEIEREKEELEELAQRQEAYETGKRRVIEKLKRGCVVLEKEEKQAKQMVELLAMIRARFEDTLEELEAIREEKWVEGNFREELDKGLILVREAEADFQKGMAKIEASSWRRDADDSGGRRRLADESGWGHPEYTFGFWLKAGLAFSLPLILVLVGLFVAGLFLNNVIPF